MLFTTGLENLVVWPSSGGSSGAGGIFLDEAVSLVGRGGSEAASFLFERSGWNVRELLERAVEATGREDRRFCRCSAPLVAGGVLMMCLHRGLSEAEAFERTRDVPRGSLPTFPAKGLTEEAFYHARNRLGVEPMQYFFEETARLTTCRPTFHGRRLFAIDGSWLSMPATEENVARFGLHKVPNGQTAYPSLKAVALVSAETRNVRGLVLGSKYLGEVEAAKRLIRLLESDDIVLLDRGLMSLELAADMCDANLGFVGRINGNWKPKVVETLGPGDFLVELEISRPPRQDQAASKTAAASLLFPKKAKKARKPKRGKKTRREAKQRAAKVESEKQVYTLRLIEYTSPVGKRVRLLSSLVDPGEFPTSEIVAVYPERWGIETSFDEVKTHMAAAPKGAPPTILRSKTPDGALQEAFALFAAYNLVREVIAKAARQYGRRPTDISFVKSLRHIELFLTVAPYVPERYLKALYRRLLQQIAGKPPRPKRPHRRTARVVKTGRRKWPTKRSDQKTERLQPPRLEAVANQLYVRQEAR